MAIEWIEGFGWLANGETSTTLEGFFNERYLAANMDSGTNKGIIQNTGPGPGNQLKFGDANNTDFLVIQTPSSPNEMYLSMKVKAIGVPSNTPGGFIQLRSNSADLQILALDIQDDWNFNVIRQGATQVLRHNPLDWHPREWFTLELYCKVDEAAGPDGGGKWEVRVNGTTIGSQTGVDTRPISAGAFTDDIVIRSMVTGSNNGWIIRDLIVYTGAGSVNNSFVGEQKHVYTLLPDGDIGSPDEDWTLSTGTDSFALLDEVSHDTDGTYISSATATDKTLLTYGATGGEGNINGASVHSTARLEAGGSENYENVIGENVTEANGATHSVTATTYAQFEDVFENNPDTAAAWTSSELDAMFAGVEHQ